MLQLVDERGFKGATIAALAKRTGLPASSIYWHFTDKDDILAAAIRHSYATRMERRNPWPTAVDERPLVEQLVERLEMLEGDGKDADYIRVSLSLALQRETVATEAHKAFLEIRQEAKVRITQWWSLVLPTLADAPINERAPETMTRLTLATLDGRYLTGQDIVLTPANTRLLAELLGAAAQEVAEGCPLPERTTEPRVEALLDDSGLESRELLIRGAAEVLCDYGVGGATVARICERVGLPPSSLYWHFSDLDDLTSHALGYAFESWSRHLQYWPRPDQGNPVDELREVLRSGFFTMMEKPYAFRLGYMLLLEREPTTARDHFRRIRREVCVERAQWFSSWLEDAPPMGSGAEIATRDTAGILAWATMTLADGLFVVEAVSPLWPLSDASPILARAFYRVVAKLVPPHHVA